MVQLQGDFAANTLEFPPVLAIQYFDLVSFVRQLGQPGFRTNLTVKDGDENIDPSLESSWQEQIWLQFHGVAHVEDLGDQDQDFELVIRLLLLDVGDHHLLKSR